jgi:hypothetical protein
MVSRSVHILTRHMLLFLFRVVVGRAVTDQIAQVHRSPGFITSNLVGCSADGSLIKEFEASHGTVSDLWHDHLAGRETSLNPLGLVEAMMGAMQHAAILGTFLFAEGDRWSGFGTHTLIFLSLNPSYSSLRCGKEPQRRVQTSHPAASDQLLRPVAPGLAQYLPVRPGHPRHERSVRFDHRRLYRQGRLASETISGSSVR